MEELKSKSSTSLLYLGGMKMDMEKIDYSKLKDRCMVTDVIVLDALLLILVLTIVYTANIWISGIAAVGVIGLLAIYHYKIKISRYLDFLDEDTPDPEI